MRDREDIRTLHKSVTISFKVLEWPLKFRFNTGQTPIIVATGPSTRDIPGVMDIPNVEHIINFNLPRDGRAGEQEYVHRMGPHYGQPQLATSLESLTGDSGVSDLNNSFSSDLETASTARNQAQPLCQNTQSVGLSDTSVKLSNISCLRFFIYLCSHSGTESSTGVAGLGGLFTSGEVRQQSSPQQSSNTIPR